MCRQKCTDVYLQTHSHLYRHSTKFEDMMVNRLHGYYFMLHHCAQEKTINCENQSQPFFIQCIYKYA